MPTARDKRRCALQALYQFDSVPEGDLDLVRSSLDPAPGSPATHDAGFALAQKAWATHEAADAAVAELAPDWPTYRQPVVDRSILRLAYYEMTSGTTPPKVAVNEAIELAREFSTERSPLFINGVLDKILRTVLGHDVPADEEGEAPDADASDVPVADVPHDDAPIVIDAPTADPPPTVEAE